MGEVTVVVGIGEELLDIGLGIEVATADLGVADEGEVPPFAHGVGRHAQQFHQFLVSVAGLALLEEHLPDGFDLLAKAGELPDEFIDL